MCVGEDPRVRKERYDFLAHELDTERREADSWQSGFRQECFDEGDELAFFTPVRVGTAPGTEVYPCENDFFSSSVFKGSCFCEDFFSRASSMSPARLDSKAKRAVVITSSLYDEVFASVVVL